MTEGELEQGLIAQGYEQVCVHKDAPNFEYPSHDHPVDTAYGVLAGEMTVWIKDREHIVKKGQQLEIGKHVEHRALMGKEGCKFLVGVRI